MGLRRVILESDAQNLCHALTEEEPVMGVNSAIFQEARSFISSGFDDVLASFYPRDCNGVAHGLAARSSSLEILRLG